MSITTVGEHLIHYEALGRGQPVIFIHGWLGSWRYWWSSMQGLSAHCRSFALDLWGFGDSSKPVDKYSLDDYTELLDQFIDRLGIAVPVVLVGHALGASVALRYAVKRSDMVSRLATVALPINGNHLDARLAEGNASDVASRVLRRGDNYPEVESELRKTDPTALTHLVTELSELDFARDVSLVECPLLMVFGAEDPIVRPPNGSLPHLRDAGDQRAYVSFDTCSHFPMLEEAARFNRLILEFLRAKDNLSDLAPKEYWQRRTH